MFYGKLECHQRCHLFKMYYYYYDYCYYHYYVGYIVII